MSQSLKLQNTTTIIESSLKKIEGLILRVCSKCGKEKVLEEYADNKCSTATHNSKGERLKRPECKVCTKYVASGRDKAYLLAGKPSPPPENTPCNICKSPGTSRFPILRFDHDHDTLKHRGWLCDKCNRSLGCLGDNVSSIVNVLNYLNKTENKQLLFQNGVLSIFQKHDDNNNNNDNNNIWT